jgi:hypothetical protein
MATKAKPAPKPVVKAAARATVAPKGKYVGPEKNKGLLPKGYKGTEKGKYYGPDSLKGLTGNKQPKVVTKPVNNPGGTKTGTKAGGPAAAAAPEAFNPLAPPSPVGMPDGSIVDPNQWESDQARLMAAEDDNAEYDSLIAEEQDANLTEQSEVATQEQQRAAKRLAASQKLKEFQPTKVDNKKNLDNALSYRGMGRSTAYKRKNMELTNQNNAVETGIAAEQTKAEQDYTTNIGLAAQRKQARLAAVTPRKNLLAQRGARAGVYTR